MLDVNTIGQKFPLYQPKTAVSLHLFIVFDTKNYVHYVCY